MQSLAPLNCFLVETVDMFPNGNIEYCDRYLNKETSQSVYTVELIALFLTFKLNDTIESQYLEYIIYSDSKAMITEIVKPGIHSGQQIINKII